MVRTKQEVIEIGKKYAKKVDELFDDVEVRLFGSYHRGNPKEWSDIDLAVIGPDFKFMDLFVTLKILNRLKRDISPDIEVVGLTEEEFNNPLPGSISWEVAHQSEQLFKSR
ncbi:MAG: nucleotidyltransferase domain-containing protein [Oligoflexia bacterium]|nr:nucleotidyltransferase domain-containing protein [Oligoflexia bacterium]